MQCASSGISAFSDGMLCGILRLLQSPSGSRFLLEGSPSSSGFCAYSGSFPDCASLLHAPGYFVVSLPRVDADVTLPPSERSAASARTTVPPGEVVPLDEATDIVPPIPTVTATVTVPADVVPAQSAWSGEAVTATVIALTLLVLLMSVGVISHFGGRRG